VSRLRHRESVIGWTKGLGLPIEEAYKLALKVAQLRDNEREYNEIYEEYSLYLLEREIFNDSEEVPEAPKVQGQEEAET